VIILGGNGTGQEKSSKQGLEEKLH
jgi:hypothetical protein